MAGLVGATHVDGVVFHPHAALGRKAERAAQSPRAEEGRDPEAGAVYRRNRVVDFAHERASGVDVHAAGFGERRPHQGGIEGDERVRVIDRAERLELRHPPQHVGAVACRRVRAPPRPHGVGPERGPTDSTPQHRGIHDLDATFALNSSINPSHWSTSGCRPVQNDC